MEVAFVSTINRRLYDDYGKRFLEEFSKYADKTIKLFLTLTTLIAAYAAIGFLALLAGPQPICFFRSTDIGICWLDKSIAHNLRPYLSVYCRGNANWDPK